MRISARDSKRPLASLKNRFLLEVWEAEPSELARFKRALQLVLRIGIIVVRDFVANLVKLQAMALAFKTLLSLAPLLAVIFSILKGFGVHNRIEPALAEALAPLGEKGAEITAHLIGFVDRMKAGALGSVGLVTLFVTVLSLMGTIEESFNHIWRVKSPRKLSRKFSDYLSVLLVGPLLVFAALTVTATLQNHAFVVQLAALEPFGTLILGSLRLVPYLMLWGAFAFFYTFVPNTRVNLKSALIGSLVAALLWQTVGWGFATFVASSTRYDAIYSSFAVLLLFLLWLYFGWVIVLLGVQVSYAHQTVHFYRGERDAAVATPAGRERLGLEVLVLIADRFHRGLEPVNSIEIARHLDAPAAAVRELLEKFLSARIVLPLADDGLYALGRSPETISVREVLNCVRGDRAGARSRRAPGIEESAVEELFIEVDRSLADTLAGRTLQGLVLALPHNRAWQADQKAS